MIKDLTKLASALALYGYGKESGSVRRIISTADDDDVVAEPTLLLQKDLIHLKEEDGAKGFMSGKSKLTDAATSHLNSRLTQLYQWLNGTVGKAHLASGKVVNLTVTVGTSLVPIAGGNDALGKLRMEAAKQYLNSWVKLYKLEKVIKVCEDPSQPCEHLPGSTPYKSGVDDKTDIKYRAEQFLQIKYGPITADAIPDTETLITKPYWWCWILNTKDPNSFGKISVAPEGALPPFTNSEGTQVINPKFAAWLKECFGSGGIPVLKEWMPRFFGCVGNKVVPLGDGDKSHASEAYSLLKKDPEAKLPYIGINTNGMNIEGRLDATHVYNEIVKLIEAAATVVTKAELDKLCKEEKPEEKAPPVTASCEEWYNGGGRELGPEHVADQMISIMKKGTRWAGLRVDSFNWSSSQQARTQTDLDYSPDIPGGEKTDEWGLTEEQVTSLGGLGDGDEAEAKILAASKREIHETRMFGRESIGAWANKLDADLDANNYDEIKKLLVDKLTEWWDKPMDGQYAAEGQPSYGTLMNPSDYRHNMTNEGDYKPTNPSLRDFIHWGGPCRFWMAGAEYETMVYNRLDNTSKQVTKSSSGFRDPNWRPNRVRTGGAGRDRWEADNIDSPQVRYRIYELMNLMATSIGDKKAEERSKALALWQATMPGADEDVVYWGPTNPQKDKQ